MLMHSARRHVSERMNLLYHALHTLSLSLSLSLSPPLLYFGYIWQCWLCVGVLPHCGILTVHPWFGCHFPTLRPSVPTKQTQASQKKIKHGHMLLSAKYLIFQLTSSLLYSILYFSTHLGDTEKRNTQGEKNNKTSIATIYLFLIYLFIHIFYGF